MDDFDDVPGRPLWPQQMDANTSELVSVADVAAEAGLTGDAMAKVLQALERQGCASLVLAPSCVQCASVTGHYEDPEDLPDEVFCPVCGSTSSIDEVDVLPVYVVRSWPV